MQHLPDLVTEIETALEPLSIIPDRLFANKGLQQFRFNPTDFWRQKMPILEMLLGDYNSALQPHSELINSNRSSAPFVYLLTNLTQSAHSKLTNYLFWREPTNHEIVTKKVRLNYSRDNSAQAVGWHTMPVSNFLLPPQQNRRYRPF